MSTRRGGLGRGIGSLIPSGPREPERTHSDQPRAAGTLADGTTDNPATDNPAASNPATSTTDSGGADAGTGPELAEVPGARFAELPVADITTNPQQPRTVFDDEALEELTHSVREFGVLQPVVVRPHEGGYQLVMGERRLRAVQAAGLATIPAVVRETDDDALLRDALLENLHRAQLNPLEEAAAYQQLLTEFDTTHDELAQRIGRSRSQVTNTIRLMNLPVPVQRRVAAGVLSAGHARALLGLADVEAQDELAARIVAEGLSVRATEELVALSGRYTPTKGRRTPPRRFTAPGASELAENLSDAFDTRVKVDFGRRKGRITVEFASIDDLERIVGIMAPTLATRRSGTAAPAGDQPGGDADPSASERPAP